jgi:hypothetical protein
MVSSRILQHNIMGSLSYGSKFETSGHTGTHRQHGDLEEKGIWKENLNYICYIQYLTLALGER